MLKERNGNKHSLSRCIFAGSWVIVLAGAVQFIYFDGPDISMLAGTLLTPAGLAYAAREHTKKGD